jgi:hypothetical protein
MTFLPVDADRSKVIGDSDAVVEKGQATFSNIKFVAEPGSK